MFITVKPRARDRPGAPGQNRTRRGTGAGPRTPGPRTPGPRTLGPGAAGPGAAGLGAAASGRSSAGRGEDGGARQAEEGELHVEGDGLQLGQVGEPAFADAANDHVVDGGDGGTEHLDG